MSRSIRALLARTACGFFTRPGNVACPIQVDHGQVSALALLMMSARRTEGSGRCQQRVQVEGIAERQKQVRAKQADGVAKAVHDAAEQLEQQMPKAAEFVHSAASQIERGANAVRERSIYDLVGTFNDLGRKEPLALFGGAVLAGFAISRFLKSSAEDQQ